MVFSFLEQSFYLIVCIIVILNCLMWVKGILSLTELHNSPRYLSFFSEIDVDLGADPQPLSSDPHSLGEPFSDQGRDVNLMF